MKRLGFGKKSGKTSPAPTVDLSDVYAKLDEVNAKINNLKIGGRNLLVNTAKPTTENPIKHINVDGPRIDFIDVTYDNEVMSVIGTKATNRLSLSVWNDKRLDLEPNTDYVLSGYVKAQSDVGLSMRWWKYTTRWFSHVLTYNATTDWKKFTVKFSVPDEPITGAFLELIINAPMDNAISFKQIKLEKGNIATDYTPAIEDVQGEIEKLQSKFNGNNFGD